MLLPAGCQKSEFMPVFSAVERGNVTLTFKSSAFPDSRSSLNGVKVDYRNVTNVLLLMFTGFGDNAILANTETVDWKGRPSMEYQIKKRLPSGRHTIVAIGTDDIAQTSYKLTSQDFEAQKGKLKLSEIKADLHKSTNTSADMVRMASSDFYVGKTEVTVVEEKLTRAEITMKRRESGIMVYLKNIPYQITDANNIKYVVNEIHIDLYQDQHTTLSLLPSPNNDFGTGSLAGSTRLHTFDLRPYSKAKDGAYYEIPATKTENLKTLPNSLFAGMFILPLMGSYDSQIPTLKISLCHKAENTQDKDYGQSFNISLPGEIQGKILNYDIRSNHIYCIGKKQSGTDTDTDKPIDMLGNLLAIEAAEYEFNETINVEFPPLVIPGFIDSEFSEKYIFDCVNTFEDIVIEPSYPAKTWKLSVPDGCDWITLGKFDKDRKVFTPFHINGKYVYEGDVKDLEQAGGKVKLTMFIHDYVEPRDPNSPGWPNQLASNFKNLSPQEKVAFLAQDYREAALVLNIEGKNPAYLNVKQYNAIPITDGNYKDFGISRLDFNNWFSRTEGEEGKVVKPEDPKDYLMRWGFSSSWSGDIVGSAITSSINKDGLDNFHYAYSKRRDGDGHFKDEIWYDSMMQVTCGDDLNYKRPAGSPEYFNNPPYNSSATNGGIERLYEIGAEYEKIAAYYPWFVPAEKQLVAIAATLGRSQEVVSAANFLFDGTENDENAKYWSMTPDVTTAGNFYAHAYAFDFRISVWEGGDRDRGDDKGIIDDNNNYRVRMARYYKEK